MTVDGGWRMPAEWAPHERTWMAWPSAGYTLGDTEDEADEARSTWAVGGAGGGPLRAGDRGGHARRRGDRP